jgi:hypothetical protein
LRVHIDSEREVIRKATIGAIQSSHPAWVANDGACERCWNSYLGVSRVITFFKEFRDRNIRTDGRALRIQSVAADGKDRDGGWRHTTQKHRKMMTAGGGG